MTGEALVVSDATRLLLATAPSGSVVVSPCLALASFTSSVTGFSPEQVSFESQLGLAVSLVFWLSVQCLDDEATLSSVEWRVDALTF